MSPLLSPEGILPTAVSFQYLCHILSCKFQELEVLRKGIYWNYVRWFTTSLDTLENQVKRFVQGIPDSCIQDHISHHWPLGTSTCTTTKRASCGPRWPFQLISSHIHLDKQEGIRRSRGIALSFKASSGNGTHNFCSYPIHQNVTWPYPAKKKSTMKSDFLWETPYVQLKFWCLITPKRREEYIAKDNFLYQGNFVEIKVHKEVF